MKPVHLLLALAKHRGCTAALLRSRDGFLSIDQAVQLELADGRNGEDGDVFDQEQLLVLANRAQRCCADEAKCLLDALLSISSTSVERVLSLCGIDATLLHKTIRLPQMRSSSD
ncbi:MAG: hypothetical protein IJC61_00360, partial [Oscillospiraceae bacterium]|nr:hypothetical protein [Oscillospiraceae bacterium]